MNPTLPSPFPAKMEDESEMNSLPPINEASDEMINEGINQMNNPINISTHSSAEGNLNEAPNEAIAISAQPIQSPPKAT